jgi:GNAT superfamily N-acetyltransferase
MNDSQSAIPTIRRATARDAPELARLLTSLGHPTIAVTIEARWAEWAAAGNLALVAARPDGTLAGVATLHHMLVLHRPRPVGRITALVVDAPVRGRGIGRALVAAAEEMLTSVGCGLLEITSNVRRADAHAFYEHLGYERTSFRFARMLTRAG